MGIFDFHTYSLWANLALFGVAAVFVWGAGTRLSRYADAISERTGLGTVFLGVLMLGGITSLPEAATMVTAALIGNVPLAVNDLLGGVAMQVAILAAADLTVGSQSLSAIGGASNLLLQGTMNVLTLALVVAGIIVGGTLSGETLFGLGVGIWPALVFVLSVSGLYLVNCYAAFPRWEPTRVAGPEPRSAPTEGGADEGAEKQSESREERDRRSQDGRNRNGKSRAHRRRERSRRMPMQKLVLFTVVVAFIILVGGYLLAKTGDALAEQTGLGASFIGAVLVAIATSLPEVSTVVEATKLGDYQLAFSNIFGTNLIDMGFLFTADIFYLKAAVLSEVGAFSQMAATLGIVLTAIYMGGILERQNRSVLRLGYDSLLVLVLYGAGVVLLYALR